MCISWWLCDYMYMTEVSWSIWDDYMNMLRWYTVIHVYMCDVYRHAIVKVDTWHRIAYRTCHMHIMHSYDDDELKREKWQLLG